MIIKNYEMNKINLDENKIILFYGKNEGLKNESFNFISKNVEISGTREISTDVQSRFGQKYRQKCDFTSDQNCSINKKLTEIANFPVPI